jgi:hypothetical protein
MGARFAILMRTSLRDRPRARIVVAMERPITRSLLATFIEYAARYCVTPLEWSRFIVNHYGDEVMEAARVDCVRILTSPPRGKLASADLDRLYAIADKLRAADKK